MKTPQPYDFSWAVNDYYNDYSHSESSDGKVTTGSYRVVLPDGRTQIVTYRADSYGYVADVKYTGEAKYPEYVANNYKATTYSAPAYKPTAPAYSAPAYKATAPTYSAPAYTAPTYTAPAPAYTATPVYKAPAVQPQY